MYQENTTGNTRAIPDLGPKPVIVNIHRAADINGNFRTALWTGKDLQVTLMNIPVGGDIGQEQHEGLDQFIRVESGSGVALMGLSPTDLREQQQINENHAVIVPAGVWHNIVNTGRTPLKLYSIYAPPQHPYGTVHKTKADAEH